MKKYIVVLKEQLEETACAEKTLLTPLYEQPGMSVAESIGNGSAPVAKMRDEMSRTYTLDMGDAGANALLSDLQRKGLVQRMEEDEVNTKYFVPTDPLTKQMVNLTQIGITGAGDDGPAGDDVVVAIVDSGIDVNHEDLKGNLWCGPNSICGFNVINGSNDVTDESGHGTHVAGTIAAVANNGVGITGVAPRCRIMAIKALEGASGSGWASNLAKGIITAVDNGARVINNSWGPGRSGEVHKAIYYAFLHNVVVVFAAGNENRIVTPADAAGNSTVISVGATGMNNQRASFSNYGPLVDVAAPGEDILSAVPGNKYQKKSGTSMAAPHVAGLAALLLSGNQPLAAMAIMDIIVRSTDALPEAPAARPIGSGRINAQKALQNLRGAINNSAPPAAVAGAGTGAETVKTVISFGTARDMLSVDTLPEWTKLTNHLSTPGGVVNKPTLPASQNLAFRVNRQEIIDTVLTPRAGQPNPKKIACVFCFDNRGTTSPVDDSASIIFVGVNAADQPVTSSAVEKWPGLYGLSELATLQNTVLTPVTVPPGGTQQFDDARDSALLFRDNWQVLLNDVAAVTSPRPAIRCMSHPLVFYIANAQMQALVNASGCDSIAGIFGYYESGGLNYIAPLFVAIDENNRPVSDIVFAGGAIAYAMSDSQFVLDNILTV